MNRRTLLGAASFLVLVPVVGAAGEVKTCRCRARIVREPDHKEARFVETVVEDGKTVTAIDGDKDYKTSPPTVMGLKVEFTAKADGTKIAVHAAVEYRTTRFTIVQGVTTIGATADVTATLAAGEETKTTLDVNGTPYTLTISAEPVASA